MDFVDAIQTALIADDIKADTTDLQKTSFADYPDEKPNKVQLHSWVESWDDDLDASGYSALLRGEDPWALARLAQRDLLTVPRSADDSRKAAIEAENARIEHQNKINKEEKR